MKKRITIITGKVRSGKTTYLGKLISSLDDVGGIIQVAERNRRFFVDIVSSEKIEITSEYIDQDTFKLGNYIFRRSAFTWAREKLEKSLKDGHSTIAIDEYGPLELKGEGLEPFFSKFITNTISNSDHKLLVVVREKLLINFLKKFDLKEAEIKIEKIANNISL